MCQTKISPAEKLDWSHNNLLCRQFKCYDVWGILLLPIWIQCGMCECSKRDSKSSNFDWTSIFFKLHNIPINFQIEWNAETKCEWLIYFRHFPYILYEESQHTIAWPSHIPRKITDKCRKIITFASIEEPNIMYWAYTAD